MLKHDRAYLNVDSKESIVCVILKSNAVTRVAYCIQFVSISVIQLTKLTRERQLVPKIF